MPESDPAASIESVDTAEVAILRAIVEGTALGTGQAFFNSLVTSLAEALDVRHAFVAEFADSRRRVRTLAFWSAGKLIDNVEYDLQGTPCEDVIRGTLCHHPCAVSTDFPDDHALSDLGIDSYLGVPLKDSTGEILGHLAVMDSVPMPSEPRRLFTFRIFAARAAGELQRVRLQQQLEQSERRYRDLFDEAPIPYVYEDTETRFVSANRAAIQLLGINPDEVTSTVGMSLVAAKQENLASIEGVFTDIRQGVERGLGVVELRRKDNGQPVWVQFWSRPEPDGKHTRTMLFDITARVQAEREKMRLQSQNAYLQEEIREATSFNEIVGRSSGLRSVLEQLKAVAPTDATVLITGETGTGKELVARAIHHVGRRNDRPIIKVNCAALPPGLVESELFGHEKGAFTGATDLRVGRFELANGGTIFLDEIGELPLEMQSKLLRVLQEREIERVGGQRVIPVDVRVIAATNRDLLRESRAGRFREDLFYRLNVFPIHLPPLRERRDDIPLLAGYFVDKYARHFSRPLDGIESTTMDRMMDYPWPGNIRELQNVIERAVILAKSELLVIGTDILPAASVAIDTSAVAPSPVSSGTAPQASGEQSLADVERLHILEVLQRTGWRIDGPRGAAKTLGLHPNTLRSRMKKLGIVRPS